MIFKFKFILLLFLWQFYSSQKTISENNISISIYTIFIFIAISSFLYQQDFFCHSYTIPIMCFWYVYSEMHILNLPFWISVFNFIFLCVYLSVFISLSLSFCLHLSVSISLSMFLVFLPLSVCLFPFISVSLSLCLYSLFLFLSNSLFFLDIKMWKLSSFFQIVSSPGLESRKDFCEVMLHPYKQFQGLIWKLPTSILVIRKRRRKKKTWKMHSNEINWKMPDSLHYSWKSLKERQKKSLISCQPCCEMYYSY